MPRVPFTVAKKVFDGTACLLETKGGDDIYFLSSIVVCASTIPCEEWYTKANGDPQEEWLGRLVDFGVVYTFTEKNVTPQPVMYRDVAASRLAAHRERMQSRQFY